jgi:hypothetical protein
MKGVEEGDPGDATIETIAMSNDFQVSLSDAFTIIWTEVRKTP